MGLAKSAGALLVGIGLYGSYREACGAEGWGSFILTVLGVIVLTLVAAGEDGLPLRARTTRLAVGLLVVLPLTLFFTPIFKDVIRFACGA